MQERDREVRSPAPSANAGRAGHSAAPKAGAMPFHRYRPHPEAPIEGRTWPDRTIDRAPLWCSVDLRDGNQALVEPMGWDRKIRLFETLVEAGFVEIEVGFPSASQTDFDFVRRIIEEDRIPEHVTIQVLTQARDELIERTFESLAGVRRAIVHLYNSTSTLQRRVVFGLDEAGIRDIAVRGAECVKACAERHPETEFVYMYSPESFTGTEVDYAVEVCDAVLDVWQPTPERKAIVNLPATVEMTTPNLFADRVELFGRRIARRDSIVLSVHPHNDRGCAVAAAELAVMAGAERVEGTLFGNGERTGNVDVVTLAMNLMSQGVDPELDFRDMHGLVRTAEYCNRLPVHPRHPYAGELVFTAFSGSHQDAIKKGLAALDRPGEGIWEVPYLPIDPADVGRSYDAVIRINSQSGKGGVAYVLEQFGGYCVPRRLQIEFSRTIQGVSDESGEEVDAASICARFEADYVHVEGPVALVDAQRTDPGQVRPGRLRAHEGVRAVIEVDGRTETIEGAGSGPIDAFVDALSRSRGETFRVCEYREHSVGAGADAEAVAYVELARGDDRPVYGVGRAESIVDASLRAVVAAVNRSHARPGAAAAWRVAG